MPHRLFCEVHDNDFAERAQSPDIGALYALYQSACHGGGLPALADFDIRTLQAYAPFLMRLEPTGAGSYSYAYYGVGIAAIADFDMTGKSTADFEGPLKAFFEETYARAAAEKKALFTVHRAIKANLVHTWERLVMPVRMESGTTAFIVYNRPRAFEQDFLRSLVNVLPDGIIALRTCRQNDGVPFDAQIISANPAAAVLLNRPLGDMEGHLLRSAGPVLSSESLWAAVLASIVERRKDTIEILVNTTDLPVYLRFQITPLFDGALLHMADITALKQANIVLEREQQQLRNEIFRQRHEGDVLRGLAHADPLTGALNRRGFFAAAEEWTDKHRQRTLVAMDIDCFKQVNDRYGHMVGDAAIQQAGAVLIDAAGQADGVAGRLGGDEFVCMLPLPLADAMTLIEQARVRISISPVPSPIGPIALTCSFGLAAWPRGTSIDEALRQADTALYAAKAAGRNQTRQSEARPAGALSRTLRSDRRR
ncbi:MAG: GGDEF domain-containing protein [Beijerinckiaceae bacterium]|jgi:diguanylate cyclase (GGDEF)-like protein|nr:GGDEF domain-containing protein [Beijerinckiaceae bacterium]